MGGNEDTLPTTVVPTSPDYNLPNEAIPDTSILNLISTSDMGINLIKELQGKYNNNPIFKDIITKPKEFWNFEIDDNLIYLWEFKKKLLCILHILINGRSV